MAEISVAILGLGRIGASMAMALKRYNDQKGNHHFKVTSYDSRPSVEKKATQMHVADEMVNKAYNAVANKDIVVIAMPYSEVKMVYELIGTDLRSGVVVIDTSPIKQPSLDWAKKNFPESAHLVGVTPIVNPEYLFDGVDDIDHAHEDLFDNGTMLLMPSASCIKDAVELAVDFSTLLGASPHFVDMYEHDGLMAATEGLPSLLGIASFYMLENSQGWTDGQRMINPSFGALTHHLFDTHPDDIRDLWLNNRENMIRYADDMIATLHGFRTSLMESDQNAIEAAIIEASEAYERWFNRRRKGRWEDESRPEGPSPARDMMRGVMGGYLADKLTGKKKSE